MIILGIILIVLGYVAPVPGFVAMIGWLLLMVYGLIFGAIVGAVLGLLVHAMQGGRRDFASATVMRPGTYELMVDEDVAADAVRILGWDR